MRKLIDVVCINHKFTSNITTCNKLNTFDFCTYVVKVKAGCRGTPTPAIILQNVERSSASGTSVQDSSQMYNGFIPSKGLLYPLVGLVVITGSYR